MRRGGSGRVSPWSFPTGSASGSGALGSVVARPNASEPYRRLGSGLFMGAVAGAGALAGADALAGALEGALAACSSWSSANEDESMRGKAPRLSVLKPPLLRGSSLGQMAGSAVCGLVGLGGWSLPADDRFDHLPSEPVSSSAIRSSV